MNNAFFVIDTFVLLYIQLKTNCYSTQEVNAHVTLLASSNESNISNLLSYFYECQWILLPANKIQWEFIKSSFKVTFYFMDMDHQGELGRYCAYDTMF